MYLKNLALEQNRRPTRTLWLRGLPTKDRQHHNWSSRSQKRLRTTSFEADKNLWLYQFLNPGRGTGSRPNLKVTGLSVVLDKTAKITLSITPWHKIIMIKLLQRRTVPAAEAISRREEVQLNRAYSRMQERLFRYTITLMSLCQSPLWSIKAEKVAKSMEMIQWSSQVKVTSSQ